MMKETLYRPTWQTLRVSCIKKYNPYGGFTTFVGTNDAIARMLNYINDATEPAAAYTIQEMERMQFTLEEEHACRVYRVHNSLTATHMGFQGMQWADTDLDRAVVAARDALTPFYNGSLVTKAANKWDWDVVAAEFELQWRQENYWFNAIRDDLTKRFEVAQKRRTRATGGVDDAAMTRKELAKVLGIMDSITSRYA